MPEPSEQERDEVDFQEAVRILRLKKTLSRKAEMIVGLMTGYVDIVGRRQDAGTDKPFDLRAQDDSVRIDVKTQKSGVLNVKKEKYSKQFMAYKQAETRFIPVQVVIDSKTRGWYVVPGIPTAARTALDPLDTHLDPHDIGKPFCIGECLFSDLKSKARFIDMRGKLNKAINSVKNNGDRVAVKVDKDHLAYVATVAEHMLFDDEMQTAIADSFGKSDEAMAKLLESEDAITKIAQSDKAMSKLAQSDEAMKKLLGAELFELWKMRQNKSKDS